ncbi:MAG: hypothetical protein ACQERJ_09290 [Bacillota bacterium]
MKSRSLILISICILLLLSGCSSTPPSDKILINNFRDNKSDFKKLITMFKEDKKLEYVSLNMISPMEAIGEKRKKEYQDLLKKLKVKQIKSYNKQQSISLTAYSVGLSVTGAAKGYKYWEESVPSHLDVVKNLDKAYQKERAKDKPLAFYKLRHIEGNWYLSYSVDD